MVFELDVRTSSRCEMIDITSEVAEAIGKSKITYGTVVVYSPHTTAGMTINESADPDVVRDILSHLKKMVPRSVSFKHSEGNSDAHIKTSMMGTSVTVIVEKGKMVLGTWQGIFFCEFDGPRNRTVLVKVLGK